MRSRTKLTLTIFTILILGGLGMAQSVQRNAPTEVKKKASLKTTERATEIRRLERSIPELQKIYEDRKFLDACTVLATSGEMFWSDVAQIARDGEKFAVTFNVVNEVTKEPGQYKQLVYAFDGKNSLVYFNE